ncbi:hypothetical protein [Halomarina oriensis]|uniref:Uncharacterized protein n=1 Tax=Halomarina oriensis TaxID=671145 RepID=A0A6B0GFM3_9EURY|nr:hypothetical protein [Halomarina oriensis]MWG33622.1 hypothetical protein [Halomarina oriensis]
MKDETSLSDDAPLVPELPTRSRARTDGGTDRRPTRKPRRLAVRPVDTSYAEESTRGVEEILPEVEDLSGRN